MAFELDLFACLYVARKVMRIQRKETPLISNNRMDFDKAYYWVNLINLSYEEGND